MLSSLYMTVTPHVKVFAATFTPLVHINDIIRTGFFVDSVLFF